MRSQWCIALIGALSLAGCIEDDASNATALPSQGAAQITATPQGVRVIDADTIALNGVKVRLQGVAAPERGHPAYVPGQRFVRSLVDRSSGVRCSLTGEQTFDREVGTCVVIGSDGQLVDLQAAVIAQGLARDCPRFSGGRYLTNEVAASRSLPLPGYCS